MTWNAKGIQGDKGDKGDKGDPGTNGTDGKDGAQGPAGPAGGGKALGAPGRYSGGRQRRASRRPPKQLQEGKYVVTAKLTLVNAHDTEDRLITCALGRMGASDSTAFIFVDDADGTNEYKETLVLMDAFESATAGAVTVQCTTTTDKSVRVDDRRSSHEGRLDRMTVSRPGAAPG